METKSFVIATDRLASLETNVAALNRRAAKLALTPVVFTKSAPRLVAIKFGYPVLRGIPYIGDV